MPQIKSSSDTITPYQTFIIVIYVRVPSKAPLRTKISNEMDIYGGDQQMDCDICGSESITYIRYNGTHLCAYHFIKYVDRRVKKEIRKQVHVCPNDTIAIAVSGGKDSMVVLNIISKVFGHMNNVKVHAITINEGIDKYRPPSISIVKRFCEKNGVEFHVRSFAELGLVMDDVAPISNNISPCTYCGVFRRKLMNDEARKIGAKYLATGHNLDDMTQSIMMNFVRGDIERLARLGPHKNIIPGLIPRFFPLRIIPEKETLLYAIVSKIEYWDGVCPYQEKTIRNQYRDIIDDLEDRSPGSKYSIMSSYNTLVSVLDKTYPKPNIQFCKCGEPTIGNVCKSCELCQDAKHKIIMSRNT